MCNRHATQGRLVFEALKRRPLTYAGMLALGAGNSPWRRVAEYVKCHQAERWQIVVTMNKRDGLVRWSVVRLQKPAT